MLTLEQAKEIAIQYAGREAIAKCSIVERRFGWFFACGFLGSKGFIVDVEDGHIFRLGSRYPLERDFAAYEAGFRYPAYDLTVSSVADIQKSISLLKRARLNYVAPEFEFGVLWKIPRFYSEIELEKALKSAPYTFWNQKLYFSVAYGRL
jgi:hypothetical protein